ncbi:MAG TPA: PEP-CTERM sorting domain-containing protein [Candidatus Aquilonibacter sp.]|nr:PEP-CTERM sorting domain-containing protein [Candidatus Aquilonibacter sp.]
MNWGRKLTSGLLATFALFLIASAAKADSVATYTLNDVTFADGGTASGSFTFDYSNNYPSAANPVYGTFQDIDITFTAGTGSGLSSATFTLSDLDPIIGTGFAPGGSPSSTASMSYDEFELNNGTYILYLDVDSSEPYVGADPLLTDPTDAGLSSDLGYGCAFSTDEPACSSSDGVTGGSLIGTAVTSVTETPEPSSLLLLLIGCSMLVAFYGVRRYKKTSIPVTA